MPNERVGTRQRIFNEAIRSKRLVMHAVNFLRPLEVQLQRHLDQPGSAEADDLAERPAGDAARGIVPVAVVQDVEEVGAELQLPALGELEAAAHRDVEISLARSVDGVAPEIAELAAEDRASGVGAGALKRGRVQVRADALRGRINLIGQDHIGPVEALAAQGDVLAVGDLDGVAGEQTDDRRNLPVPGDQPGCAPA